MSQMSGGGAGGQGVPGAGYVNCVPWVRGERIAEMGYGMCKRMRAGWLELWV